jgi:hypothetical protein
VLPEAARGVHVPLVASGEQRCEERKALDVVPMHVAEHEMSAQRSLVRGCERKAEAMCTSPAIEDDERPIARSHLDTRRVAAVAKRENRMRIVDLRRIAGDRGR